MAAGGERVRDREVDRDRAMFTPPRATLRELLERRRQILRSMEHDEEARREYQERIDRCEVFAQDMTLYDMASQDRLDLEDNTLALARFGIGRGHVVLECDPAEWTVDDILGDRDEDFEARDAAIAATGDDLDNHEDDEAVLARYVASPPDAVVASSTSSSSSSSSSSAPPPSTIVATAVSRASKREWRTGLAKNFLCTWPQNGTSKEVALERILALPRVVRAVVCEEKHADGSPHLHAVIVLNDKDRLVHADLDAVAGKHGNYQVCGSPAKSRDYVTKAGNFIARHKDGSVWELAASSAPTITDFMGALRDGLPRSSLLERFPNMALRFWKVLDDVRGALASSVRAAPAPALVAYGGATFPIGSPRWHRAPQYWIYGPPSVGKSYFLHVVLPGAGFRGYQIPANNDFVDWNDDAYDYAYSDELNDRKLSAQAPYSISWLNQWLDGGEFRLNFKGGSRVRRRNLTTFLVSNIHPREFFRPHAFVPPVVVDAIVSRLCIIRLPALGSNFEVEALPPPPTAEQRAADGLTASAYDSLVALKNPAPVSAPMRVPPAAIDLAHLEECD